MSIPEKFREALLQEFGGFYNVSELPLSWDEWSEEKIEKAAALGVSRMKYRISSADLSDFAAFLRAESQNRQGTLVREIEAWTNFRWSYKEHDWKVLQRLLLAMATRLEAHMK